MQYFYIVHYHCNTLGILPTNFHANQRSGHCRRVCMRGVTMARVHSYGKGRAGVGLITAVWVMGTELAHLAVASYSLQLCHATPYGTSLVSLALRWWMLISVQWGTYLPSFSHLFFPFRDIGSLVVLGIRSCSGRALFVKGEWWYTSWAIRMLCGS